MKRPPLLIAPDAIQPPRVRLTGPDAHRVQHTLRLRPGSRVRISDGVATVVEAELDTFDRNEAGGTIIHTRPLPPEPMPAVEVVHVLPKPALADRVIGPCTALGVAALRFAPGEHTPVAAPDDGWARRLERWQSLARHAAEQSGRGRAPTCAVYDSLAACLADTAGVLRLMGDEAQAGAVDPGLTAALATVGDATRVQWIIGPEGGFSTGERALLEGARVHRVGLGPHILRVELAAVVAVTLTMYELSRLS